MIYDYVNCNNCNAKKMKIRMGSDKCPKCKKEGCLSWCDDKNPEIVD